MSKIYGEVLFDSDEETIGYFKRRVINRFLKKGASLPTHGDLSVVAEDTRLWSSYGNWDDLVISDQAVPTEYWKLLYWCDGDVVQNELYPVAEIKQNYEDKELLFSHERSMHPFYPVFDTEDDKVKFYKFIRRFRGGQYFSKSMEQYLEGK
jgi:hypothetical protein